MACTWKNCVLLAAFLDKILIFHSGQMERYMMVHSERRVLLASFDVALPSEREKPSWITWTIEISPPHVQLVELGSPHAGHVVEWAITKPIVSDDPWHHIDQLYVRALACSHGARATARSPPPHAAQDRRAPLKVPQHFDGATWPTNGQGATQTFSILLSLLDSNPCHPTHC